MQLLVHTDQRITTEELGLSKESLSNFNQQPRNIPHQDTGSQCDIGEAISGAKLILLMEHSQFGST